MANPAAAAQHQARGGDGAAGRPAAEQAPPSVGTSSLRLLVGRGRGSTRCRGWTGAVDAAGAASAAGAADAHAAGGTPPGAQQDDAHNDAAHRPRPCKLLAVQARQDQSSYSHVPELARARSNTHSAATRDPREMPCPRRTAQASHCLPMPAPRAAVPARSRKASKPAAAVCVLPLSQCSSLYKIQVTTEGRRVNQRRLGLG